MTKTLILGAALALALGGAAAAQDRSAGRIDRDGDRRVSLSEMQAAAAARFARMDANRDGRVTREERRQLRQAARTERRSGRGERLTALFARQDADRNGVLTRAEAPRAIQRLQRFDADRDGALTLAEIQSGGMAGRAQARAERRADRQARRDARQGAGRAVAQGDGVLTQAEMMARVQARFARLDADRDGFVTREERRAARAARRG